MSVYLPKGCDTYYYAFIGERSGMSIRRIRPDERTRCWSDQQKLKLRQQLVGIRAFDVADTPRFQDWAVIYLRYQEKFVDRPDLLDRTIGVSLNSGARNHSSPTPAGRERTHTLSRRRTTRRSDRRPNVATEVRALDRRSTRERVDAKHISQLAEWVLSGRATSGDAVARCRDQASFRNLGTTFGTDAENDHKPSKRADANRVH
jgi:hypothetical protein